MGKVKDEEIRLREEAEETDYRSYLEEIERDRIDKMLRPYEALIDFAIKNIEDRTIRGMMEVSSHILKADKENLYGN